jgi:hypothetical protein
MSQSWYHRFYQSALDAEIIELVAGEFGHEVEFISAEEISEDDTTEEILKKILYLEHR